jgi:hypothetical protein
MPESKLYPEKTHYKVGMKHPRNFSDSYGYLPNLRVFSELPFVVDTHASRVISMPGEDLIYYTRLKRLLFADITINNFEQQYPSF